MNTNYQVPFTTNPPIKTYPGYAFVLSLLFATSNKYYPWLLNQYIPVLGNKKGTRYEFMPVDPFHVKEGIMQYMSTNVSSELLYDDRIFTDIVSAMIRQGFGMTCWMNERFIPNRDAYQRYDYIHDNMVVGYDSGNKMFTILGYSPKGIFEATPVSLSQTICSLVNTKQKTVSLNFIRPQQDFVPAFNFDDVCMQINQYLSSTSIDALGYHDFYGITEWETGISATYNLSRFPIQYYGEYDIRLYAFLKDRLTLMFDRIKYIMENGYLRYDASVLADMSDVVKIASSTHLIAMKYNMVKRSRYCLLIQENIERIVEMENTIYPKIASN